MSVLWLYVLVVLIWFGRRLANFIRFNCLTKEIAIIVYSSIRCTWRGLIVDRHLWPAIIQRERLALIELGCRAGPSQNSRHDPSRMLPIPELGQINT